MLPQDCHVLVKNHFLYVNSQDCSFSIVVIEQYIHYHAIAYSCSQHEVIFGTASVPLTLCIFSFPDRQSWNAAVLLVAISVSTTSQMAQQLHSVDVKNAVLNRMVSHPLEVQMVIATLVR